MPVAKHAPQPPTARHHNDMGELDARMVARASGRPRQESGETWLSRWAPYPAGARRGPYAHPTRTDLTEAQVSLQKVPVSQSEDAATTPAVQVPTAESVPVPECLICKAAHNRRTLCRARQDERGIRTYGEVVAGHPHQATDPGSGMANTDSPEDVEPECPDWETTVADDRPVHERAGAGESEALTRLRARVHEDYARRQQYGPLGRSL